MDSNLINNTINTNIIDNKEGYYKKHKKFIIGELILSILHFIPSFFIFGLGMVLDLILLVMGAGASKNTDVSGVPDLMNAIFQISLIPMVIVIVLFVITVISTVKYFRKKDNKTLEKISNICFIVIDTLLLLIALFVSSMFLLVLTIVSLIVYILGLIDIFKSEKEAI